MKKPKSNPPPIILNERAEKAEFWEGFRARMKAASAKKAPKKKP